MTDESRKAFPTVESLHDEVVDAAHLSNRQWHLSRARGQTLSIWDGIEAHVMKATLEALRHAESAPEGWKLVPVEPTEEMLKAVFPLHWKYRGEGDPATWFIEHYRRAVAAAPQPPNDEGAV